MEMLIRLGILTNTLHSIFNLREPSTSLEEAAGLLRFGSSIRYFGEEQGGELLKRSFKPNAITGSTEDFFKDLQEEYQKWKASAASQAKPTSLSEELAEIGEEFVEFLEKALSIDDADIEAGNYEGPQKSNANHGMKGTGSSTQNETIRGSNIEENVDDVEAALAQLKKELGL